MACGRGEIACGQPRCCCRSIHAALQPRVDVLPTASLEARRTLVPAIVHVLCSARPRMHADTRRGCARRGCARVAAEALRAEAVRTDRVGDGRIEGGFERLPRGEHWVELGGR